MRLSGLCGGARNEQCGLRVAAGNTLFTAVLLHGECVLLHSWDDFELCRTKRNMPATRSMVRILLLNFYSSNCVFILLKVNIHVITALYHMGYSLNTMLPVTSLDVNATIINLNLMQVTVFVVKNACKPSESFILLFY